MTKAMGALLHWARVIWLFAWLIPATVICSSLAVFATALRLPRWMADQGYQRFGHALMIGSGVRLRVHGREHLSGDASPAILVCNHESNLDAPALVYGLSHRSIRSVIKAELLKVPVLGWGLSNSGCVAVQRGKGNSRENATLIERASREQPSDLIFFAEGTRSEDGQLHPFKKGAFHQAINTGRPIVPLAIGGAIERLPPHTIRPFPGPMWIVVGEPIPVDGLTKDDVEELRDRTREAVASLRQEALRRAGSPRFEG